MVSIKNDVVEFDEGDSTQVRDFIANYNEQIRELIEQRDALAMKVENQRRMIHAYKSKLGKARQDAAHFYRMFREYQSRFDKEMRSTAKRRYDQKLKDATVSFAKALKKAGR